VLTKSIDKLNCKWKTCTNLTKILWRAWDSNPDFTTTGRSRC